MPVYKVTYASNKILSVKEVSHVTLTEDYTFEASKVFIMHAFVKATDIKEAERIGDEIKNRFLLTLS
jgi:hypothetical protein